MRSTTHEYGWLRCQETRRPTSDVEVATPLARDFNPSLALRFPSTIASKGSITLPTVSAILLKSIHSMRPL